MAPGTHIPSLAVGGRVQDVFRIAQVQERTPTAGDPFTVLILANSTGQIPTVPFWPGRQDEIAGLGKGQAVKVIGEVVRYRERLQLRIISIRALPRGSVDSHSLRTIDQIDDSWEAIDRWRDELTKPRLMAVLDLFYEDDDFRMRYEQCPATIHGHHAVIGGLLTHTTEVAMLGRAVAQRWDADPELVLAGALLRDIGKLDAYRWDGIIDYTERGRLLGHVRLGVLMLEHHLADTATPRCTDAERSILIHLVQSTGECGRENSAEPLTLEGMVLRWAHDVSTSGVSLELAAAKGQSAPLELPGIRSVTVSSDWGK